MARETEVTAEQSHRLVSPDLCDSELPVGDGSGEYLGNESPQEYPHTRPSPQGGLQPSCLLRLVEGIDDHHEAMRLLRDMSRSLRIDHAHRQRPLDRCLQVVVDTRCGENDRDQRASERPLQRPTDEQLVQVSSKCRLSEARPSGDLNTATGRPKSRPHVRLRVELIRRSEPLGDETH